MEDVFYQKQDIQFYISFKLLKSKADRVLER